MILSEEKSPYVYYAKRPERAGHLLDQIAEEVHKAWMEESAKQGRIAPGINKCPKCDRLFLEKVIEYTEYASQGHFLCRYCNKHYFAHPDMIPYEQLSESVKNYDRAAAQAVINALQKEEISNKLLGKLSAIIAAIAEQSGGKIAIQSKHLDKQGEKVDILEFMTNSATGDMEITLHKCRKDKEL